MERCDFASVSSILLQHIRHGISYTQDSYISDLFFSVIHHTSLKNHMPDKATVSKWLSGTIRVNPDITEYYQKENRQREMAEDIEKRILPRVADQGFLVQELYELVIRDVDISEETKNSLCQDFPWKDPYKKAEFIRTLICFGMGRQFIKRDAHHGIPGIGKSELAKAYAKEHKKEYTNILYLSYSGSLKKDISDLPFADDRPTDSEIDLFRKHNRFLRTLKSDTLIIIDNFDTLPEDDNFLPVVLKYRCRILFTTRSIFSSQAGLELTEIEHSEDLFRLVSCFYPDAEKCRPLIEEILEVIHRHTMCTELVARLLAKGLLPPDQVLAQLKKEHASFHDSDRISISKDGRNTRKTYNDHLRTLFSLFRLTGTQMDILRNLSLVPLTGIHARLFAKWMDFEDLNDLNDLIEMGLVKEGDEFKISLHPMIREVVISISSLSQSHIPCDRKHYFHSRKG